MTQIRRSQFITTYGPGAILEGPHGPRMILSLEHSRLFDNHKPEDFEITDRRLSHALLEGAGIVRIPSNAELGRPEFDGVYQTHPFPSWALCPRHAVLYRGKTCPLCFQETGQEETSWDKANRQAVRFVRACPAGHLDDVDWVGMVHQKGSHYCRPSYLKWVGSGSLRNIDIVCPKCGASINLGLAYSREWTCSGRFPEKESTYTPYRPGDCQEKARIIQRGASNLRIAEIVTSLTIPESDTQLHRYLEMTPVFYWLRGFIGARQGSRPSKDEFVAGLRELVAEKRLAETIVNEIDRYDEAAILKAIADVLQDLPDDPFLLRVQEFTALQEAATKGRTISPTSPGYPPQFEVIQKDVRQVVTPSGRRLRVTPINRLRVVMVQKGYRRAPAGNVTQSSLVPVSFDAGGRTWYPGVELFGEGIFIDLWPGESITLDGPVSATWQEAWKKPEAYSPVPLIGFHRHQFHPLFVWWHTLSHRLINALAVDSGYSSAAIRERVYIDVDENTGRARGGVLLYTAQPGGDGTLGGLIALVPEFERVLQRALYNLDACSNDPLCGEEKFGPGKYNGAACYACALVSETSCEHRNMSLDRNLLLETTL